MTNNDSIDSARWNAVSYDELLLRQGGVGQNDRRAQERRRQQGHWGHQMQILQRQFATDKIYKTGTSMWQDFAESYRTVKKNITTVFGRNLDKSNDLDMFEVNENETYYISHELLSLETDVIKAYSYEHYPESCADEDIIEMTGLQLLMLTKLYGTHIEKIYEELI